MRITSHPVLEYHKGEKIPFTYEGQQMFGYVGEPIAAALHANGIKVLHQNPRPRGFFCAIGVCSSCMMQVNGVNNVRTCVTLLEPGMVINRQQGQGILVEEGE